MEVGLRELCNKFGVPCGVLIMVGVGIVASFILKWLFGTSDKGANKQKAPSVEQKDGCNNAAVAYSEAAAAARHHDQLLWVSTGLLTAAQTTLIGLLWNNQTPLKEWVQYLLSVAGEVMFIVTLSLWWSFNAYKNHFYSITRSGLESEAVGKHEIHRSLDVERYARVSQGCFLYLFLLIVLLLWSIMIWVPKDLVFQSK